MAPSSRALSKLAVPHGAVLLRQSPAAPRLFLQASRRTVDARPVVGSTQALVARQFRHGYASEAAPVPPPKKPRFRKLRWTWRLSYLATIAGLVYLGYGIYLERHPEPQVEPDPTKKTLVILGKINQHPAPCAASPSPAHLLTRRSQELAGALSRSSSVSTPKTTT